MTDGIEMDNFQCTKKFQRRNWFAWRSNKNEITLDVFGKTRRDFYL